MNAPSIAVVLFDRARTPRSLRELPVVAGDLDAIPGPYRRLVVVGTDADLAAVLSRLLRSERLDVEIAYLPARRTRAARAYGLPSGFRAARRALRGTTQRTPLIRDETGTVLVGRATWLPPDGADHIQGEAVVDDTVLFDGAAAQVWIEPTAALPGVRAALARRVFPRWVTGRAAQLGTTGAAVVRDGVPAPRTARRSTFYRNVEGWLLVR
ncbi:peptidase M50 [Mycobacterium asiaticum]|uniref:Peptidase M50 n=1 Tax=Mycobacterium asiaticum TaxID=1790 RepID=A0A1A3NMP9_MYCAS|nr:peptidase M50 [Mycobacterium asiaticum]OBK21612.1 peptidase M50 [Mycobacterium asiaticum]